jgi:hypothetical protein
VLDAARVASLLDQDFRGLAKTRQCWHVPVRDRRNNDRLSDGQRAFNRLQAWLRALVEQSIGNLANRGHCVAGASCRTGSGISTGPLGRWSASAVGSTGSHRNQASRTSAVTTVVALSPS